MRKIELKVTLAVSLDVREGNFDIVDQVKGSRFVIERMVPGTLDEDVKIVKVTVEDVRTRSEVTGPAQNPR